jgi:uncharacterized protein (TIGR00290 family)
MVVCMWSGGKDSCLALHKAIKAGYKVYCLLNFTSLDTNLSRSHHLKPDLLRYQAERMCIKIIQQQVTGDTYTRMFKKTIQWLKDSVGIEGIIFGDIYLEDHKMWIDKVCQGLGVKPVMPLWGENTAKLLDEFVGLGFEAIVVSVRKEVMGRKWLGCKVDGKFRKKLASAQTKIDPCGEEGEFHTLVLKGPLFKRPIEILNEKASGDDKHWFLEILSWR